MSLGETICTQNIYRPRVLVGGVTCLTSLEYEMDYLDVILEMN